jgi:hypothetical protein
MSILLGLRLPGAIRRLPFEDIAVFAREAGLDALDLPADFAGAVEPCRANNLAVGSVDGVVAGELISADERMRAQAVDSLTRQIVTMSQAGLHTLFLCLVPKNDDQAIAQSLAYFKESFPAVALACEAAGVRIALEGWPGPAPRYHTLGYTPELWRAMFDAVPSRALGLCYDPSARALSRQGHGTAARGALPIRCRAAGAPCPPSLFRRLVALLCARHGRGELGASCGWAAARQLRWLRQHRARGRPLHRLPGGGAARRA